MLNESTHNCHEALPIIPLQSRATGRLGEDLKRGNVSVNVLIDS